MPTITRTGYTFLGWYYNNQKVELTKWNILNDCEFVAHWEANKYNVHFDSNGGEEIEDKEYTYDSNVTLPTPIRIGYTFLGWYNEEKKVELTKWNITSDCDFVAYWKANEDTQYIINHYKENINDDDFTLFETEILYGTSDTKVEPNVNNYDGFVSPQKQKTIINPDGSTIINYYYYRKTYDVSFVTNGGNKINTKTYKYEYDLDVEILRTGYTFGGWFTDEKLQKQYNDTVKENLILYAYWKEENKPTDFEYIINGDNCSIQKYIGTSTKCVIPGYIGDKEVVTIKDKLFYNNTSIESITIPNSVATIGENAFDGCSKLSNVTLSENLESIGNYAFSYCSSLTSIILPNSVTTIGESAFDGCRKLTSITIPNSVNTIGSSAFFDCGSLETIYCETEIKPVGWNNGWNNYYNAAIVWGYIKQGEYNGFTYAIQKLQNETNVIITGYIGGNTNITIPSEIEGYQVKTIVYKAFYNCSSLKNIIIPDSVTTIGKFAFYGCSKLSNVTLSKKLESIGNYTFSYCSSLTSIILPNSVTTIGESAFDGCSKLTSITIPNSVTTIGGSAFFDCSSLTSITIPNKVTFIGSFAFYNCSSLTNITIPNSVTIIGESAFDGCSSLKTIFCEAESKPVGWDNGWNNYCNAVIVWGYKN